MITKPTVLILGAGSNVEYGFPTGDQLRMDIVDGLGNISTDIHKHFIQHTGYLETDLFDFSRKFKESSESIDRFLERNTVYKKIGYECIAYILTTYERDANLYRTTERRWYDYLWRTLDEGQEPFVNNKLSIITFNYDRSLEHYLAMALKRIHHFDNAMIGQSLGHFNFIYLYGTIGGRPFIDKDAVPFGDTSRLDDSAATIKIIRRDNDEDVSDAFEAAHEEISKAEYIFILGFGFDSINCGHLAIREHLRRHEAKVFATAFGMSELSMAETRKLLKLDDNEWKASSGNCLKLFDSVHPLPTR